MSLQELLDEIDAVHPGVIGLKVSETLATVLLRSAFQVIRAKVESIPEGELQIDGLGLFRIRNVQGKDGVTRPLVTFGFKRRTEAAR
jgi:hypothetical protein